MATFSSGFVSPFADYDRFTIIWTWWFDPKSISYRCGLTKAATTLNFCFSIFWKLFLCSKKLSFLIVCIACVLLSVNICSSDIKLTSKIKALAQIVQLPSSIIWISDDKIIRYFHIRQPYMLYDYDFMFKNDDIVTTLFEFDNGV